MRYVFVCWILCVGGISLADDPLETPDRSTTDKRHEALRTLNGYFPFKQVRDLDEWNVRQAEIKRRILVSQGLWPLPTKSPLNATVDGKVEREDYSVERVVFESLPGHFVTGSLYRPKAESGLMPAVLSPHGHWKEGRFYDAGEAGAVGQIDLGAETNKNAGRFPLQARAVQLARMGCIVFHYDMTGYADAVQLGHRPQQWDHLDTPDDWGFMSVQADLRLQNMMGLQTWNSIRAVDFLMSLDDVDASRIGVTGASGGGTQSMILGAIDQRIAASMPCVMVSTAMQGGCTCENAPLLRVDQGNIDIAAATAPRPLGLTAADDWTVELETKGYPDLFRIYEMLGVPENVNAVFHTQFKHNYNEVNRAAMYEFFNKHFRLGVNNIQERDFEPLSREESTVWSELRPEPTGDQVGDVHEQRLLAVATRDSDRQMKRLIPKASADLAEYRGVIGGAWETILGRRLDQVHGVVFEEDSQSNLNGIRITTGRLRNIPDSEQLVLRIFEAADGEASQPTVIWVADGNTAPGGDTVNVQVRSLVENGFRVLVPTLLGQDADDRETQRMWYQQKGDAGWHRFSGYTFGFNHCLFAQRTHDLLSVIQFVDKDDSVALVGIGATAGPLVVAACSQSPQAIDRCVVDLQGFRFADVKRHDQSMFVPGAVKYLDIDGLLSLCEPTTLLVVNGPSEVARQVYAIADGEAEIRASDKLPDMVELARWMQLD
ncbi:MAG: acetylxylan esterase [Rubripirellula sp.]